MLSRSRLIKVFVLMVMLIVCVFPNYVCAAEQEESKVYECGDFEIAYYVERDSR